MTLRATLSAALLLLAPSLTYAQVTGLRGRFEDPAARAPVSGVAVKLTSLADTSDVRRATSGDDGSFKFIGLGVHSYRLEAVRIGFAPLKQIVRVTKADQDMGTIALTTESVPIAGITVTESPAPAIQKADTTEFNAGAVKVHKDANAEDLVQKLPGVTLENGQVRAQGEQVQQVLVNGRPFFGSDPTAAMRNLPADVVDRIQVYDRMSDQAEFSGFDDGQSQKTMNFILRDRKARFGKVYAGGGDQGLYQTGGNASIVRGTTRLTLIGMSNNINQKNFSPQDLFGAMSGIGSGAGGPRMMMFGGGGMRPPGGGGGAQIIRMGGGGFGGGAFDPSSFFVNQSAGISTTHAGGGNYVTEWGKRVQFSSSIFLNDTDTDNQQRLARRYLPPQDSLAYYDQFGSTDSRSDNQRFDARLEWTPDTLNSVIVQPRLYFQGSDAGSSGDANNSSVDGTTLSAANSRSSESIDGDNLSNRVTLRHRFGKRGRNVSADLNIGHTRRNGDSGQRSLTEYYSGASTTRDTLDQRTDSHTLTNSYSARLAFTEPLRKGVQAQLIYNPSLTKSDADARAVRLDPFTGLYTVPDSALSNSYENRNVLQNGGLSLLYTRGTWRLLTNASYQQTRLHSEQTFPVTRTIDRTFGDVLPSVTLTGTFASRRSLRVAYNASTTTPSIGQLQNVVNNSNPLSLTSGNPDLRPTYNQTVSIRFQEADPAKSKSRFLFANVTHTDRTIANSTFTALSDTTLNGVDLARGTQLTAPANLGESWNANVFAVYSRPTPWLKSILSLNGGGSFTRTPTRLNGVTDVGSNWSLRSGAVLASNISQNLDFTVSYQGNYNIKRNTRSTGSAGDSYNHTLGVRLNAVVGPGVVLRQELNHNLQGGVPSDFGQNVVLWNTTVGKKFMKDQKAEIRLTTTDVLAQNRSVNRSTTETYVQDSRDRTLGRYVQAVLTYNFK